MSPRHCVTLDEPRHATHNGNNGARPGSRPPSIPRCGVSSPFRGHLSTKSNEFCIGHSSRLSDQYRIRDHMQIHYNKIISAKAAVDCSIPKSMIQSIKYSDQQRRESMKKEVVRLERTPSHSATTSRRRSRDSADSVTPWKDSYDPHCLLRHSPYSDPGPVSSPSSFISLPRDLRSPAHAGELQKRHTEFSRMHCGLSTTTACSSPCKFQDNKSKTYSGDLLEKHSHHFTKKERPFTPRTLKTQAKSALAQSRYYTAPRRKRIGTATETETQTGFSSFQHASQTEGKESKPVRDQEGNNENLHLSDDEEPQEEQALSFSRLSSSDFRSPSLQKIHSEEEELMYLKFVADVTNEILTLGLFSDRALEHVFQRHREENKHRLNEGKMCHLLDILRTDLNCKKESNLKSVVNHAATKGGFNSSPWDVVMNGSAQEEVSSYLDDLFINQLLEVETLPNTHKKDGKHKLQDYVLSSSSTRDTELKDYVLVGVDEDDDHHHKGNVQTDQGDGGDCTAHDCILSTLDGRGPKDDRGSTAHEHDYDLHVLKTSEDNLLLNVTGKDEISDNLTILSHVSEKTDFETFDDLQQSFYDVIQVSRGDVSDP